VHRVALDRYMDNKGLNIAREEIELMTGMALPYAPRWINSETIAERYANGSIKHSTLVVTVTSRQAADAIMAKGLSFGGKRHEVERFWEKGEGGICMRCCGRDHFGKCTEIAKCYVCADQHEGSEHRCSINGCGKKATTCEHQAAKCANCGGSHMATSARCPERWQQSRNQKRTTAEVPSSPPVEVATTEINVTLLPQTASQRLLSETPNQETAGRSPQLIRVMPDLISDFESLSPTPTPRARDLTPMTIDDDSDTA
jgi:hypothetical protein